MKLLFSVFALSLSVLVISCNGSGSEKNATGSDASMSTDHSTTTTTTSTTDDAGRTTKKDTMILVKDSTHNKNH